MTPDDVAAIGQDAVQVYQTAVSNGVPAGQAELAAVAHTVVHWPATDDGDVTSPPSCSTPGCKSVAYAVLVGAGENQGTSSACMGCMLDRTLEDPDLTPMSWTGQEIDLVERS